MKFKDRSLDLETPILFDSVLIGKQLLGDNGSCPSPISCPQEKRIIPTGLGEGSPINSEAAVAESWGQAVTSEPIKCIRCHRYLLYPSHFGPHRLIRRGKRYNPEVKLLRDYNPDSLSLMSFPADRERGECFDLHEQKAERTTVWSKAI